MRGSWLVAALLTFSCKDPPPPEPPPASPPVAGSPAPAGVDADAKLRIYDGAGTLLIEAKKRPDGNWNLKDASGEKIGKVKVQGDRVKVKDNADTVVAKVKKKDDGFKLLDQDEKLVFKAKYRGGGELKIKTDDAELGRLTGLSGTLQGKAVAVEREGDKTTVKRDGQTIGVVRGDLPPEPAALIAFEGLTDHQKIALLIFVQEVL